MHSSVTRILRRFSPGLATCIFLTACSLGAPASDPTPPFAGPPRIHIAAPLPGQTFLSGAKVIVQARVENAGPDLARISVWLDEDLLGEERYPNPAGAGILPLTIDWLSGKAGDYRISVEAQRGDGAIARESVTARVISDIPIAAQPTPVEAHGGILAGVIVKPANLRAGPGAAFDLVTNIPANQVVEIVGRNQAGDWYLLRHDERDAWIYAEMVDLDGDPANLPHGSAADMAAADGGWVNLVVEGIVTLPNPLVCGEAGNVIVTIRNEGVADTSGGGFIELRDSAAGEAASFQQVFGPVPAGGSVESQGAPVTVSFGPGARHQLGVTIDSGSMIAETDEDDNSAEVNYTLAPGSCD